MVAGEQPALKSPIDSRKNSARGQSATHHNNNNGSTSPNHIGGKSKQVGDINKT